MRASYLAIVAAHVLLSGCAVGPKYKRPELPVPTSFRAPEPLPEPQAASLADLKWFEVFRDEARLLGSQHDRSGRAHLGSKRSVPISNV